MVLFVWLGITCAGLLLLLTIFVRAILLRLHVDNFTNRTVFITGCDSGFGNLLSRTLDAKGVRVIAGCFTKTGANNLKDNSSSRLLTVSLDVTDKESVKSAFEFVRGHVKETGLWGLVNNAGIMPQLAPSEWLPIEDYERCCDVNLFGPINMTLTFLPLLRQARGRLVNVCSVTSTFAYPGLANYVISKAGMKMFTLCIRRELYNSGVTAHTIEPGGFATQITDTQRLIDGFKKSYKNAPNQETQDCYGGDISEYILHGIKLASNHICNKPQVVADAMTHALLGKYPKGQYHVGMDANFFFRPLWFMPEWISDFIVSWPAPGGQKAKALEE